MRFATGSQMLNRRRAPVNSVPREGTRLRATYDLFQANKGLPIAFMRPNSPRCIDDLINYYGLDIRCLRKGQWVLAGEWFGRVYLDYIAEHVSSSKEAA